MHLPPVSARAPFFHAPVYPQCAAADPEAHPVPPLLGRVVHPGCVAQADSKTEAADRSIRAHRRQAVEGIRGDVHEVALSDLPGLAVDGHSPASAYDIVEFMRVV